MSKPQQDASASADVYQAQIRVRYAECDAMGLLHHAKYWEYFEEVRTHLLRDRGTRYRDLEALGVFFVVYKCSCVYKHPIRYDEVVTVRAWVTRITRTRVDHAYEIVIDGVVCCEAATTLACVNREGKPMVMPEHMWPDV